MRKLIIGIILVIILVVGTFGGTVMADRPGITPADAWYEILEKIGVLASDVAAIETSVEDVSKTKVWQDEIIVEAGESTSITFSGENPGRMYLTLLIVGSNYLEDIIAIDMYINEDIYASNQLSANGLFEYEFNTDHTEIYINNNNYDYDTATITVSYIATKIF